jgi:hypothetical protein
MKLLRIRKSERRGAPHRPRSWLATRRPLLVSLLPLLLPASSWGCAFVPQYRLPVPFEMYAWASSVAVALSFVIAIFFARAASLQPVLSAAYPAAPPTSVAPVRSEWTAGQVVAVALLLLSILTGLFGTQNPFVNFNTTMFWIIFVLAVPYVTLLSSNFYESINPWAALVRWCQHRGLGSFAGFVRYPQGLGYYPALTLYAIFIWLELFGQLTPGGLSFALLDYSLLNIAGAWVFGYRAWFRYGELFSVFLRLIGYAAPLKIVYDAASPLPVARRWRIPFSGLLEEETESWSLLVFILFMLSSTAYDGLHQTRPFVSLFWQDIYPHVSPLLSSVPRVGYEQALTVYTLWQSACLIASPFVYLAVFLSFVAAAKILAKSQHTVMYLSLRFALSLIPIAIVYHITHYYATLLEVGPQIVRLISDPFGLGWNLFGTANLRIPAVMLSAGVIWMSQVVLIVAGHVVSVLLAHIEALRIFPNTRSATASQLPLLLLMILFTVFGLKILSLPLAPAQ